jgi:hypothetical protein
LTGVVEVVFDGETGFWSVVLIGIRVTGSSFVIPPNVGVKGLLAPPMICCHLLGAGEDPLAPALALTARPLTVEGARWCDVFVAVVGTAAAGVNDNLFISGNSRLFRRRGDPARPEGEAGFEWEGEILLGLTGGMGTLRFGFLPPKR